MMKNKKEHKTALPELRFPEFRDSEGWILSPLSQLLDYERPDSYIVSDTNYCNDGTPVLTANKSFILGYTKEDYGICNNIPVVIFDDFTVDKKYVDFPFKVKSSAIKILRPKKDNNLRFAFELMNCIKFETAEHKRYYISSYQTQTVPIPQPNEQNKIANCFSSLDDLISAVTDKIEALKEYKKGLMQQLFPAKGKTVPARRFPEFQNAGEWENKVLSDVCKLVRGPFGGALKKEIFVDEGYAVYEQSHAIHGDLDTFRYYITEDKFNELMRFEVCPNDIIMSCSGTMGKFTVIPEGHKKGVINQALLKLSTKKGNDYSFIKFLLELPSNQEQLLSESAGGAIKNVASVGQIKEMALYVPELKEQQKIADCLSSVDNLISVETAKLAQLKAHKKGLMLQLFPKI